MWQTVRYGAGLALAGVAIWLLLGKTDELAGATTYLARLRWQWMLAAAAMEGISWLSFAALQRQLLRCAKASPPLAGVTAVSLAGNAVQTSLPAGIVLAAAFLFRQYRRFGADEAGAGWVLIVMTGISFVTLSVLAAAGLALALGSGSTLGLVEVILGIVALAALLVVAWIVRATLLSWAVRGVEALRRIVRRPARDLGLVVERWLEEVAAISPTRVQWAHAALYGMGNWLFDLGCLAFGFLAVGAGVPWRGLLLAYGAAQLASNLPVTPGGLGVVEGSLTVALVAFGGAQASTVAAVLVYRLLSFWIMLPIGWSAWASLALRARLAARSRAAPAPVVALPGRTPR